MATVSPLPLRGRLELWPTTLPPRAEPVPAPVFAGTVHSTDFGPVTLTITETPPTGTEVRRTEPESYLLVVNREGHLRIRQDHEVVTLGPGDMVVLCCSRAFQMTRDPRHRGLVVRIEPSLRWIAPQRLRHVMAVRLSDHGGIVSLVSQYLSTLGTGSFHPADAQRLLAVTMSLISIMLIRHAEEAPTDTLFARIEAFILSQLGAATLTPETIAAAHHISIRTLHRLFRANDATAAGWIRERRLERCRADLRDPLLAHRSVRAVSLRWGFTDVAHFTRIFKTAYGTTPAAYRSQPSAHDA